MGRAKGFRRQAGFGIHLQRGCLATSRGCLTAGRGTWPRAAGGACPQVVHTQVPAEACLSTSRTTSTLLRELQFSHLDNHLYSFSYGPTCAPVPHQGLHPLSDLCPNPAPGCAPTPRQSLHPLSDLCPVPHRNPHAPSWTFTHLTPAPRSFPPPQIPLGCARADIHDEADPALAHTTREHARKDPRLVRREQTRVTHARTWNIALGNAGWRSHEPTDADAARPTDLAALDGAVADPARPCGGESSQGSRRMGTARLPLAGASPARVCDRDREAARRPGSCGLRGAVLPTGDRPLHGLRTHVLPVPRPNRGPGYEYPTSARTYCAGMRAALVLCPIQAGAHSGRFPSARRGRRMRALERRDHGVRCAALRPTLARVRFLPARLLMQVAPRR